ncbi:MAG TPA: 23S rRNA (pseudouridine(1915)-N(3))-methyltransferase RlmH, partial [Burkholderiaceae bacterium]|nr:23S rRNA (pseudouridine(1915)-N(3))-methyltransferase RlmH [Burkholderiaceae bacterium]
GSRQPAWVGAAFDDYASRMPADWAVTLKEIKPESRSLGRTVAQMLAAEALRIRQAIPPRATVVALDERGERKTSEALSQYLTDSQQDTQDLAFLIGGADGLCETLRAQAHAMLRLSDMTLPHGMVRVILAEQLYRAWSIAVGHPYHRSWARASNERR